MILKEQAISRRSRHARIRGQSLSSGSSPCPTYGNLQWALRQSDNSGSFYLSPRNAMVVFYERSICSVFRVRLMLISCFDHMKPKGPQ